MRLSEAVELTGTEIERVLAGRQLAINELGAELAARIAPKLPKEKRDIWEEPGPHAAGQPTGDAVVHFCIRVLALQGVVCFAPHTGNRAPFVLVDEWLGHPIPNADPKAARDYLLRRHLRSYGRPRPRAHASCHHATRTPRCVTAKRSSTRSTTGKHGRQLVNRVPPLPTARSWASGGHVRAAGN
jgi:hypothetical protein